MKVNILGVPFDNLSREVSLEELLEYLEESKNHIVVTPNPEIVMHAQNDIKFMNILQNAELVIPDGIGIVIASKILGSEINNRVEGCDLVLSLFEKIKDTSRTVYLLGGKPGVVEKARCNMQTKYQNINIIGIHDGYFDENEEGKIIEEIQDLKPDILLVGLGYPKQEKWIYEHRHRLPVKISMGVGGSIDIMAGSVKRAPKVLRKFGLEWLYRLLNQPKRIFRMSKIPLFLIRVFKSKKY